MGLVADVITTRQMLCLFYWLMFCQLVSMCGRCCCHSFCGRCYCHSGRWNSHRVLFYFSLSSGLLHRTSSHIWDRWYLPMFLFRDGLLTLMYRASFMVLIRFWSSLPTMLNLSLLTSWPDLLEWSYIGEGAFRCSLNLSANVFADSQMYSSSHSTLSHLYLYLTPLFSGCDLYPLEPLGGFWWWDLLWNALEPHTSCMIFLCSHWDPDSMEPPYMSFSCCHCSVGCCCFFFCCWGFDISFLLCPGPRRGICISLLPGKGIALPCATHLGLSRWYLLCDTMFAPHCTLMELCGGCPTVNISQCEWVSYTLKSGGCHHLGV